MTDLSGLAGQPVLQGSVADERQRQKGIPCRVSLNIVYSVKGKGEGGRERERERQREGGRESRERGGREEGRGEEAAATSSEERLGRSKVGWKWKEDLLAWTDGE